MITLRGHMKSLEDFIVFIKSYKGLDFYKYTIITNNLERRVLRIKEYLSLDIVKSKKKSFSEIFKNGMKFM